MPDNATEGNLGGRANIRRETGELRMTGPEHLVKALARSMMRACGRANVEKHVRVPRAFSTSDEWLHRFLGNKRKKFCWRMMKFLLFRVDGKKETA